jgi:hypothetical protein
MIDLFFRIFQHLLPRSRAWSIVIEKTLRNFFEGLTGLPTDFKAFIDQIYLDVFPDVTRQLSEWETQFGIVNPASLEADRRDALQASWARGGGMGSDTLQDTLQAAGFPLFVHDAWYFTPAKAIRNPNLYLVDSDTSIVYTAECGVPLAQCGELTAQCGDTSTPTGVLLVNKIVRRFLDYTASVSCGEVAAECGEVAASMGDNTGFTSGLKPYFIPSDPNLWPYFWYAGAEVFGDSVQIPTDRKEELETLVLKIGPTHLWAGLMVDYV